MALRIIKVLSLLLFLIGCSKQSPQELLEQSKIMITNQNYSEALKNLRNLVEDYPQSTEAAEGQYMMGDTYIAFNKNFEGALEEYRKVVSNFPESKFAINAQFMIGYVFANFLNDYESARLEYEKFLQLFSSKADSGLVESVKFELRNLGKDLNEIPQLKHISP